MALPYRWQWRIERWKKSLRSLFGGGDEQPRPKICPACGALVGISATRCHECGTSLTFSLAAASMSLGGLIGGETSITTLILSQHGFASDLYIFYFVALLAFAVAFPTRETAIFAGITSGDDTGSNAFLFNKTACITSRIAIPTAQPAPPLRWMTSAPLPLVRSNTAF